MNLRQYIFTMLFATTLCWVALFFVMINVDPFETNILGFVFFYVSLFLSLLGTVSLVIFLCYRLFSSGALPLFRYVQISFRQSMFISIFVVIFLFLQGMGYLTVWNSAVLISIFVLLISFSLSVKRTHSRPPDHLINHNTVSLLEASSHEP
jgi:hypothetical protein